MIHSASPAIISAVKGGSKGQSGIWITRMIKWDMGKISSTEVRGHFLGQTSFVLGVVLLLYLLLCFVFLVNKLLNLKLNIEFFINIVRLGLYVTFMLAPLAIITGVLSRYFSNRDKSGASHSLPRPRNLAAGIGITSGLAYYLYLIVTLHMSGLLQ